MECFIKFGKTNSHFLNSDCKFVRYNLYVTLMVFVYKCAGHMNFYKIFVT